MGTQNHKTIDIYQALLLLDNKQETYNFLKDLCTPAEITAMQERWRVCQLLERNDLSYRDIHQVTGASLTTIGRVARCLRIEQNNGYKAILNKIKNNEYENE